MIRKVIRQIPLVAMLLCVAGRLGAQHSLRPDDLRVIRGAPVEDGHTEMLVKYLLRLAEQATGKRLRRLNSIRSEGDFMLWQESNRRKFLELIGGLPAERKPLNARVTGEFARQDYVVRKLIFESLPEFYVTANLYVPTTAKPPYPAVLSPCGHSRNGKDYDVYQHLYVGLVKRGYVVLTWDPLGQGERIQYWDFLSGRRRFEFNQHGMAGIQEYLLGWNLARYFIWDGIRALDYLSSLPEVDASRIGVTGNSGGGTLTTYISMLDPRVRVASIVTYITSIPKKIENRINDAESDPEQDIAGLLAEGLDHPEFIGMIAPRPVQIGAATRDFFPVEGTRKTFAEVQGLYKTLGVPERVRMVEFDHPHMYSQPLREATYAWFDHWLKGADLAETHEPEIVAEKDETLQSTPTGQVVTSLGGKTVYDFNRDEAGRLIRALEAQRREAIFQRNLAAQIRARLALPSEPVLPRAQKTGETEVSGSAGVPPAGLVIEKFLLQTEPGIAVPVRLIFLKDHSQLSPAVVYLRDRGGEEDNPTVFESLARGRRVVAVADVRGFGETKSPRNVPQEGAAYFDPRDGMDADFTYASFFLGRPILGMRVWDALHVVEFLHSRPEVDPKRISIAGRGWAGVSALFAAAVDAKISAAAVEAIPASYSEIALGELYEQPVSLMLPGSLRDFDLSDVIAAIAPRPVLVLNPTDALTREMDREAATKALGEVQESGPRARGADVRVVPLQSDARETLEDWLLKH